MEWKSLPCLSNLGLLCLAPVCGFGRCNETDTPAWLREEENGLKTVSCIPGVSPSVPRDPRLVVAMQEEYPAGVLLPAQSRDLDLESDRPAGRLGLSMILAPGMPFQ